MLANYAIDEIYLSETPSWMFEESNKGREARDVFEKFALNLAQAEQKMRARNEDLKVPYTVLYPSKIPAGKNATNFYRNWAWHYWLGPRCH